MSRPVHHGTNHTVNAMPGPDDTTRVVLDNGLVLLVRENHAAPVVVIEGHLPAGSVHESADQAGLASFVASMLTRGSAAYDFDAFNETIEGMGAHLGVSASDHATSVGGTSLSEDFSTLLNVLADVVQRPTFPAQHMARVRSQTLVQIQERDEDTEGVAMLRFRAEVFGDHPYGRSGLGYATTVPTISRNDLVAFHQARYTPQGAVLSIVGDIETDRVVGEVTRQWRDWQGTRPDRGVPSWAALDRVRQARVVLPGKTQADLVIGGPAVARAHPDYFAVRVANTILGRFGMMGRLGEVVREEMGLAYYVYSTQEAGSLTGVWYAAAGVNPAHVDQAVAAIQDEFARLCDEPVGDEELADTQAYLTGVLPLTLETDDGVASALLNMEWHNLGLDYLQRYNSLVYAITPADVQRVARTYLRPDAYALVVAGPPAKP
jgi:zinc protease